MHSCQPYLCNSIFSRNVLQKKRELGRLTVTKVSFEMWMWDCGGYSAAGILFGGAGIYETPTAANGIYARPELNIDYYMYIRGWDPIPAQEHEGLARLLRGMGVGLLTLAIPSPRTNLDP